MLRHRRSVSLRNAQHRRVGQEGSHVLAGLFACSNLCPVTLCNHERPASGACSKNACRRWRATSTSKHQEPANDGPLVQRSDAGRRSHAGRGLANQWLHDGALGQVAHGDQSQCLPQRQGSGLRFHACIAWFTSEHERSLNGFRDRQSRRSLSHGCQRISFSSNQR